MKAFFDNLAIVIATGFGSGFAPKAPGTFGSLAAIPFIWLFHQTAQSEAQITVGFLAVFIVGMWSTARTEAVWKVHDDSRIVIDEFAGMLVTLAWFPFDWLHVVLGFALFRLFDIWKPGPIGYIDEKGPGAWGTFFDDVVAGAFAAIALYLISTQLS